MGAAAGIWFEGERFAELMVALKTGRVGTKGELAAARKTVESARDAIFKGVALDVDGTLTEPGHLPVDPQVARMLADLLRRGIPIFLITGRGRSVLETVVQPLLDEGRLPPHAARRLFALTRNGTTLLRSNGEIPEGLITTGTFDESAASEAVAGALADAHVQVDRDCALDVQAGSARLVFREEAVRDTAREALDQSIESLKAACGSEHLFVTSATYETTFTLDLSAVTKNQALESVASRLGIEPAEVLRIGDRGDQQGNDFDLLACEAGFTVGSTSADLTSCLPVFRDDGSQMIGPDGVAEILRCAHIAPPIRLSPDAASGRRRGLANAQAQAREEGRAEFVALRADLRASIAALVADPSTNKLAGTSDVEFDDIFDPRSGAVRFRDDELVLLDIPAGHAAYDLFELAALVDPAAGPRTTSAMLSDTGVLLRGPLYYFGEVSKGCTNRAQRFAEIAVQYVNHARLVIQVLANEPLTFSRYKVVLGIADNVRNILCQILFLAWTAEGREAASPDEFPFTRVVTRMAIDHTELLLDLLFRNRDPWAVFSARYLETFGEMAATVSEWHYDFLADAAEGDDDIFRMRECDSIVENVAAVRKGLRQHVDRLDLPPKQPVLAVGLPFGGVEMPLIAAALANDFKLDVTVGYMKASVYEDRAVGDGIRATRHRQFSSLAAVDSKLFLQGDADDRAVIILDDNSTTGVTIEWAHDLLLAQGLPPSGVVLVRYPTLNRIRHMEIENHGFPDPDLLHSFIAGLAVPPPYTRLHKGADEEGDPNYKDVTGRFDKSKERLKTYLQKNGLQFVDPIAPDDQDDSEAVGG